MEELPVEKNTQAMANRLKNRNSLVQNNFDASLWANQ
jgi:hypothetical protein